MRNLVVFMILRKICSCHYMIIDINLAIVIIIIVVVVVIIIIIIIIIIILMIILKRKLVEFHAWFSTSPL